MDLIKELGLTVFTSEAFVRGTRVVSVVEIESKINKLPVVYGLDGIKWSETQNRFAEDDTHKARILGVEKIVREPLSEEFVQIIPESNLVNLMIRKNFAGKRVKVVVTEIQEGE